MPRARFAPLVGLLASLAVGFAVTAGPSTAASDEAGSMQQVSTTTYPTNAAKIFRWGNAQWHDEFITPLASMWRVNQPANVRTQHGMLTLDATPRGGSVVATVYGHNRRYGRWEARVRGRQYSTTGTPYHAVWELVPVYGGYHCAARNVILSDYVLGSNRTDMHVRNTPDLDYTTARILPLSDNEFHTYAVEVTPDHISWFVDTHVIRTERRSGALSAAVFTPRFRLIGQAGATMNQGRMQMDWMRYYTLDRPNAQPITAPELTLSTYAGAC
jgi:hypothetical protein